MIRQTWLFAASESDGPPVSKSIHQLFEALPGVLRLEYGAISSRSTGQIRAAAILDVYFSDEDAMNAAYACAEGRRISREVMNNAAAVLDVLIIDNPDSMSDGSH
ncbi:MAG: hypothetical protein M5R41_16240 [Bacteroidia bacterium]|nr:hypothetical protein [Bacteroidia bacterium]